jgi:hypothetical protein
VGLIVPLLSFFFHGDDPCLAVLNECTDMLSDWKLVVDELEAFAESQGMAIERMT